MFTCVCWEPTSTVTTSFINCEDVSYEPLLFFQLFALLSTHWGRFGHPLSLFCYLCYVLDFCNTLCIFFSGFLVLKIRMHCTRNILIVLLFALWAVSCSALEAVEHLLSNFEVTFTPILGWTTFCILRKIWFIIVVLWNLKSSMPMEHLWFNNVFLHEFWVLSTNLLRNDFTQSELKLFINEEVSVAFLNFPRTSIFWTHNGVNWHAYIWSDILFHALEAETMAALKISSLDYSCWCCFTYPYFTDLTYFRCSVDSRL